jgi:hypothetical protein
MVFTVAVRERGGWSRRAVLRAVGMGAAGLGAGGASGGLAGCSWFAPDPVDPPPPDPLEPLLAVTRQLVGRYEATVARHPDLTDLLSPVLAAHVAHADVLRKMIDRSETAPPTGEWVSPPTPVPPREDEAVGSLREAEREAYDLAAAACLAAAPDRAAPLGSICAACGSHLEVLR